MSPRSQGGWIARASGICLRVGLYTPESCADLAEKVQREAEVHTASPKVLRLWRLLRILGCILGLIHQVFRESLVLLLLVVVVDVRVMVVHGGGGINEDSGNGVSHELQFGHCVKYIL